MVTLTAILVSIALLTSGSEFVFLACTTDYECQSIPITFGNTD